MRKPSNFFFAIAATLIIISSAQRVLTQEDQKSSNSRTREEIRLELNKEEVYTECPTHFRHRLCPKDGMNIEVSAVVEQSSAEDFSFIYKPSAGKIIGSGSKVVWDLQLVPPGRYTITVEAINLKSNAIRKGTTSINLAECPECDLPCNCPNIYVTSSSEIISAGKRVTFFAEVRGGKGLNIRYKWSVTGGKILSGQGTTKITVKTNRASKSTMIIGAVEIESDELCPDCYKTEKKVVSVRPR